MEKFIHAFNLVPGIGYIGLQKIHKRAGGFQHAWERASVREFLSVGISKEVVQNIIEYRKIIDVAKEIDLLWQKDVFLLGRTSAEFPRLLTQTDSCPFLLYRKGAPLKNLIIHIAMVGTRVPSLYGQEMALAIGEKLAAKGAVIVSGLAFGIDAICHHAAIKQHLPTVAVLASGVEYITPSSHITLAENILQTGGTIISEYAGENVSYKYRFLERNRIIAGMCKATIVIEAAEKSGALITSRHANDQNRDVYALVGDINRSQAMGCNNLIAKNSAIPITNIEELLASLGLESKSPRELSDTEKMIMHSLADKALNEAQISQTTNISVQQININLTRLELDNLVKKKDSKWKREDKN